MELARRTLKNSLYGLASFTWPIVLTIVATPYIVGELGSERYGLFSLAVVTVGFLGMLDLGMSQAVIKFVSDYRARNEYDEINRTFATAISFYLGIGLAGLGVAVLGTPLLVEHILNISSGLDATARTVFYLTGVAFFMTMLLMAFSSIPVALQRYDIHAGVTIVYTTLTVGITVILVSLGRGVADIVLGNAVVTLMGVVAYFLVDRRLLPLGFWPRLDRGTFKKIFSFSGYTMVSIVTGHLLLHLDKFILGSLLSVGAVTFYVIPGTLAMKIHAAVAQLSQVIFPLSSELLALDRREQLQRLYIRATRLVFAFVTAVSIPALVFAGDILRVWLGDEFAERSTGVFVLLLVTYAVLALTAVPYYVAVGAGRPQVNAAFSVIAAALNVLLVFLLVPPLGLSGAGLAYLVSLIHAPLFVVFIERRIVEVRSTLWLSVFARVLPVGVIQAVISAVLLKGLIGGVASLILILAVAVATFPVIYILFGFAHREDRLLLKSLWTERVARTPA